MGVTIATQGITRTHWSSDSDNTKQLHHIRMLELPIDGSLLEELDCVGFRRAWFQCLQCNINSPSRGVPSTSAYLTKLTRP